MTIFSGLICLKEFWYCDPLKTVIVFIVVVGRFDLSIFRRTMGYFDRSLVEINRGNSLLSSIENKMLILLTWSEFYSLE